MAHAHLGEGYDVYTVIFEFTVEPWQQKELSEKIQALVHDIVCHQPGFISSHLHLSQDGEKVINYFQWESRDAFDEFRRDEEKQQRIRPVIGPYKPQPRAYDVVYSAHRNVG
ncbi:heme-degrading monooxygenase HmoA [Lewinella marina]|nr:antibiotic biosynthesis monooxygenase family protein [Neolewinella marina]NJB84295.1 heme-degrading monooxygenase HmoA [Neolewinella marina]